MDDATFSLQEITVENQEQPTRKQQEHPQQIVKLLEGNLKKLNRKNARSAAHHVKSKVKRPYTRCAVCKSKLTTKLIPTANYLSRASQADIAQIKTFARRGGPDLTDIRGSRVPLSTMDSSESDRKQWRPMNPPSETTKSRRSSTPYDPGFEQHLINHGIYSDHRAKLPKNMEEITARLAVRRPSVSPSQFSDTAFQNFRAGVYRAKDEGSVILSVIPTIQGLPFQDAEYSAMNTSFRNLKALTNGTIVPAQPDLYYGSLPEQLDEKIQDKLSKYIIPSNREESPLVPNFFLEVKGPRGIIGVARLQACYAGAVGARGIQMLQSYGLYENTDKMVYDNKTYTITSTYFDGTLKLFAIHPTLSIKNSSEYHMNLVTSWDLTKSPDDFRQGVAAFRNARDFAREQRNKFIAIANSRSTLLS